jgi:arylsulfatase A-like enzyme/predicted Zn-dependent protease
MVGRILTIGLIAFASFGGLASVGTPPNVAPSLVLLTLDTTRADALGCYGAARTSTPNLDALAARGTRYARALTASPLTLPAHASLLTGLDPPFHGVRDNGTAILPPSLPTLATVLAARGYTTAAFISSRVLDRRFGLDRGFQTYGDRMAAERQGEHGYAERDAEAVTSDAIAWLSRLPRNRPYVLWVHYYDPHSPYSPPGEWRGASTEQRYAGEVAYMDREIRRLLGRLPMPGQTVVAAVGDHGEMLGEHGERDHGLLLYRASLEVPLVLAGPGVPSGRTVPDTVGTRALPATLLALLGAAEGNEAFGRALPGLPAVRTSASAGPVYGETWMPATAYGWSPLRAASDTRWRFVLAPSPELFDFVADPAETRNLVKERGSEAQRLRSFLADVERASARRRAPAAAPPPEVVAALRSLGYLSGSSPPRANGLDPKDGVPILKEFDRANEAMIAGRPRDALPILENLVRRSPGNVPFLSRLSDVQAVLGRSEDALATVKEAIALNPRLDFLHLHLANTYKMLGRLPEARAEYEAALALNPRMSQAWLALGELAKRSGRGAEERRLLERAVAADTASTAVLSRLAQIETAAGELRSAESHAAEATSLVPEFAAGWWVFGEVAEKSGRRAEAITRYEKAIALGFGDARAHLALGRLLLAEGRVDAARDYLTRAATRGGDSPAAVEARRLLARVRP